MTLRFDFGRNWQAYLTTLTDERIDEAQRHIAALLAVGGLTGKTFLDVGCGSGLSSLAARRLGARVVSFDFDLHSVACTRALRDRFAPNDADWSIERGDVLDANFMDNLGRFDVVHAWGVLHHTGSMWTAIDNAQRNVGPQGTFVLALYNDQGWRSHVWRAVKYAYSALPAILRPIVLWPAAARLWGPTVLRDGVRGAPLGSWRNYAKERGMSPWHDIVDWVGGYPFEVADRGSVESYCRDRGLILRHLVPRDGIGCNEFVLVRA